jgi:hypothetical protein
MGLRGDDIQGTEDLEDPSHVSLFPVRLGAIRVTVVTTDATGPHAIRRCIPQ